MMMIGEPPPTQVDLHFQLGNIPVRVHPFFWLAGVVIGYGGYRAVGVHKDLGLLLMLVWVFVFFMSILVHEMGHAIVMQRYGLRPRVLLYMMGGLAIADSTYGFGFDQRAHDTRSQIVIAFAGPAAGFLLAIALMMLLNVFGMTVTFRGDQRLHFWHVDWSSLVDSAGDDRQRRMMAAFVVHGFESALFVNIFWGLLNLMPVYPLDGGQISRNVFLTYDPANGIVRSLWLSVFAAIGVAVFGLMNGSFFMAVMFGSLAFSSYNALQMYTGRGGFGGPFSRF